MEVVFDEASHVSEMSVLSKHRLKLELDPTRNELVAGAIAARDA